MLQKKRSRMLPKKIELAECRSKLEELEIRFNEILLQLPNLPHPTVPKGKLADDNETVKESG